MNSRGIVLMALLAYFIPSLANAQEVKRDSVEMRGNHVYLEGRRLTMRGIENQLRFDEAATEVLEKAKRNFQFSQAAYVVGAALIITPLATSLTDNEPLWGLAVAGSLSIGAGLLMTNAKNKWLHQAIGIYHSNLGGVGAGLFENNCYGLSYSIKLR